MSDYNELVSLRSQVTYQAATIEQLRKAMHEAQRAIGEGEWVAASDYLRDALLGAHGD